MNSTECSNVDVEACVRLLHDLILMLAPHDAQSIADAAQLTALKAALPGMGKDSQRLDWLNGRLNWFTTQGPGHDPQYRDIRERIDAAQTMTPEYVAARAAQPEETRPE